MSGAKLGGATALVVMLTSGIAAAQGAAPAAPAAPTGAPPPDAKALVEGPKAPTDVPDLATADDVTTLTLSSGGLLTTGNSRTLALTGSGLFESRFDKNGIGASIIGNYGQSATPGNDVVATAQNVQGRLRYDRYVLDRASVFLLFTGRHDRFQGLDFRLNIDPGLKYLFYRRDAAAFWGEVGYDFQYDVRRDDALAVLDDSGAPVLDLAGQPVLLDKTRTDHSARLFAGFRNDFNQAVTLSLGVEYLQSVVDSSRWRVNFEGLLAAKIAGGLAFGVGVSARYDHEPLPTKKELDTTTSVNLIYAFTTAQTKEPPCPCPDGPPPPCPTLPPPPPETEPPPPTDAPAMTPEATTSPESAPIPATAPPESPPP